MDMLDMLRQTGGLEAMAGQLGIDSSQAAAGAEALLPAILGGFKTRSRAGGAGHAGLGDLIGMLEGLGGRGLADNVLAPEPTNVARGNDVLGQIFGSKDVSRTVAGQAAQQSGLSPELLKKMLPILAMLVGGYLSSGASRGRADAPGAGSGGALGGILGSVLGGGAGKGADPNLGSIGSMLDFDGDGNPLDDIIGMAGKFRT